MADRRDFFENLVYGGAKHRRFTQQSPVMPDVWIQYGMNPGRQQELLMVPNWHYTTADLTMQLKERLRADGKKRRFSRFRVSGKDRKPQKVVHNQNVVAATLWFDELVRAALPLSSWWLQSIARMHDRKDEDALHTLLEQKASFVKALVSAWEEEDKRKPGTFKRDEEVVPPDVLWLARVAGLLIHISTPEGRKALGTRTSEDRQVRTLEELLEERELLARALLDVLQDIGAVRWGNYYPLYSVNLNRTATNALTDSVAAVKGDASGRLFRVRGKGVRWAVIDSGVDAKHVAFRERDAEGRPRLQPFGRPRRRRTRSADGSYFVNNSRVVATYDFVHIRELLSTTPDGVDELSKDDFPMLHDPDNREELRSILRDYDSRVVDWERLEPFLRMPETPREYRSPVHPHGTHVAGIIGADWRASDAEAGLSAPREDMAGVCPDIDIIDLRVLDENGEGNEFAIMSAMQFVRDLNARKDFVAVHGVNLSLSIPHDVANYACGRTPVCEEAERLVGSGIVVVAAAGNSGRARYLTPSNEIDDGFRTVSITDPGNAESVITVGATHRRDAHTYGVSYFSSRGPTGDGRLKPDLVAPGEKIRSTVPEDGDDRMDGTSMAAPHVSGAAALIMARNPELIGQPRRIKEVICNAATDLGRERYFQGAGFLDVLRALQSI